MKKNGGYPTWIDDAGRRGEAIIKEARRLEELARKQSSRKLPPAFGHKLRDFM